MREVFQQELREVQDRLVQIAELVETAIQQATTAFGSSDVALAEQVLDNGEQVDQLASELDEQTIDILARQQPVASDLRMSASLERMADLAQHIAQLARYRYPESAIPEGLRKTFAKMGVVDVKMAGLLVALLRDQDAKVIDKIRDLDDDLDELHAKVFEKVLSQKVQVDGPTGVVDATLASRYHERFGDHAVDITKQMNFFLNGELQ